jgi:UDP-glucuronate 4-epimerase
MLILVTGAAGFIAYHLIRALKEGGHSIVGIDNLNAYYDPKLKYNRLKALGFESAKVMALFEGQQVRLTTDKLIFEKLDLANRNGIEQLFLNYNFDMVVNLGAQAGVRYSIENPTAYVESNLVGFANILEGCRQSKVKHLVYASSSSVYGLNLKQPFSTEDKVDSPVSFYAATKKSNELMAHAYSHLYNIPTTGLRFFTVYGPMGRPDMAYFTFTKKILKGETINVYNNGEMKRDFTYIDDIVEGVIRVMNCPPVNAHLRTNKELDIQSNSIARLVVPYRIYNIGNNQPITLRRFIRAIEAATGKKANEVLCPMQPGDVTETYADIDELIRDTGFKPKTSIEEGIEMFVDWYKRYYKND